MPQRAVSVGDESSIFCYIMKLLVGSKNKKLFDLCETEEMEFQLAVCLPHEGWHENWWSQARTVLNVKRLACPTEIAWTVSVHWKILMVTIAWFFFVVELMFWESYTCIYAGKCIRNLCGGNLIYGKGYPMIVGKEFKQPLLPLDHRTLPLVLLE